MRTHGFQPRTMYNNLDFVGICAYICDIVFLILVVPATVSCKYHGRIDVLICYNKRNN